jgi:hypothetical protein
MSIYGKTSTPNVHAIRLIGNGSKAMPDMPAMSAPMNWHDEAWRLISNL